MVTEGDLTWEWWTHNIQVMCYRMVHLKFLFFRFYLFSERGEGREKESKRNIDVWLPLAHPQPETRPATQVCALIGIWSGDPLVHRLALNPPSHTSQGWNLYNFISQCHPINSIKVKKKLNQIFALCQTKLHVLQLQRLQWSNKNTEIHIILEIVNFH